MARKSAHHYHIKFIMETSDLENILNFTRIHTPQTSPSYEQSMRYTRITKQIR